MSVPTKNDIRDACLDQPVAIAAPYRRGGDFWEVACSDKDGRAVFFRYSDPRMSLEKYMLSQGMDFDNAIVDFHRG